MVTQYYPPEGALIPSTVARGLAEKGHQVSVLTGFPNYPSGNIYPGYKQKWRHRERDGLIEVLRVPLYADHSTNIFARSLNYLSFALSVATARGFAKEADVIYIYATQMTPAFGPWLWRKFGGAPYVLHVQDLWPDSITGSSMVSGSKFSKIIEALLNPWLKNAYRSSTGVIGIAPTMVSTLIKRGAHREQTALIYNWADSSIDREALPSELKSRSVTNFLYAGNVGDMQDLETVVRAAKIVKDAPVKVTIVGDGVSLEGIKKLSDRLGVENIEFKGRVPRHEMAPIYEQADFALVTLKDLPVFRGTIPSKFQASLAHGIPVLTNVQGDLRGLVEELRIGLTADAEDPESLAEAFVEASGLKSKEYSEFQRRALETYKQKFSLASGVSAIEEVLENAVEQHVRREN